VKVLLTLSFALCLFTTSQAQVDSILNKIDPQKWSASVEKKVSKFEKRLIAKSEKTLERLKKREEKIYEKQLLTS
jgi:hypothetical protein